MAAESNPKLIGTTELWAARLDLDTPRNPLALQNTVTEYVRDSGITVVGYYTYNTPALILLRWPDVRPGYTTPSIPDCEVALLALAAQLHARSLQRDIIPRGKIHTMMGRKKDGYGKGETVPLQDIQSNDLLNYSVTEGYMVSARTVSGREVEVYGEPVGGIATDATNEDMIHVLGDRLKQHNYAIERGPNNDTPGRTDFYETFWAVAARAVQARIEP